MVTKVSAGSLAMDDFAQAEQECKPIVIRGLVRNWPAVERWKGREGAEYIKNKVGKEEIKVMCSESNDFHGALERHQSMTCRFEEYLDGQNKTRWEAQGMRTYLAQTPVNKGPMSALLEDVEIPKIIEEKEVMHINLWMSTSPSRSSPHYDPYNNILCVVTGSKQVHLWNPSLTPAFYPLPFWGESANHAGVDFANPDYSKYPNYRQAQQQGETIILEAGDALFIPEGWWHQVDSQGETIGMNFWWRTEFFKLMQGHMGPYYLREALRSITSKEVESAINQVQPLGDTELCGDLSESESSLSECSSGSVEETPSMSDWINHEVKSSDSESEKSLVEDMEVGKNPPEQESVDEGSPSNPGRSIMADFLLDTEGVVGGDMPSPSLPPDWDSGTRVAPRLSIVESDSDAELDSASPPKDQGRGMDGCIAMGDLEDSERQGLLWLAGLLCTRGATNAEDFNSDGIRNEEYTQCSENTTRWLRSFSSKSFCRIIYVFASSFPSLVPLFWEVLNPVGAYVMTSHFDSLEEQSAHGMPDQQEFFSRLYGDNGQEVMQFILHGRETVGKLAARGVLEKQMLRVA